MGDSGPCHFILDSPWYCHEAQRCDRGILSVTSWKSIAALETRASEIEALLGSSFLCPGPRCDGPAVAAPEQQARLRSALRRALHICDAIADSEIQAVHIVELACLDARLPELRCSAENQQARVKAALRRGGGGGERVAVPGDAEWAR